LRNEGNVITATTLFEVGWAKIQGLRLLDCSRQRASWLDGGIL